MILSLLVSQLILVHCTTKNPTEWSNKEIIECPFRKYATTCHEFTFPKGSTADRHKSLGKFLRSLPHPVAVFAANDFIGETVIACCSHTGLNVPEDVAVLAVDNVTRVCEHTKPTLSSIAPDFRRGGNLAVMMLLAARRSKGRFTGSHNRHFGIGKIVRRASTTKLQRHDPQVAAALEFIRRERPRREILNVSDIEGRICILHRRLAHLMSGMIG